jgi:hypothetical protein
MARNTLENILFYMVVLSTGALMLLTLYSVVKKRKPDPLLVRSLGALMIGSILLFVISMRRREGFGEGDNTYYITNIQYMVDCYDNPSLSTEIKGGLACYKQIGFLYPPYVQESETYFITIENDKIVIRKDNEDQFIAHVTSVGFDKPTPEYPASTKYYIGEVEIINPKFEQLRDFKNSSVYYGEYPELKTKSLIHIKDYDTNIIISLKTKSVFTIII